MRRFLFAAFVVTLILLPFGCTKQVETAGGFDWPQWRGPDGNGVSSESGWNPAALAGGPKVRWRIDLGLGYASVVIRGNLLVSMGNKNNQTTVYGLRADTGKQVWKYSYESTEETQPTPAIDGDSVYALDKEGLLLCLDSRNGRLRWKKNLVADFGAVKPFRGFAGSPVIVDDLVILTVNTAGMALDKKTGNRVWISDAPPADFEARDYEETNGADYATPVVYERQGKSYALVASWKGISSVEVQTGQPLWVYEWELYSGRHVTDPVVIGDTICVTDNYPADKASASLLFDASGDAPRLLWKSPDLVTEITSPVAVGGYLYGGQEGPYRLNASLRCIDLKTGKLMWDKEMGGPGMKYCVSLMAADGKLIVLSDDGTLSIAEASPEGYKELSSSMVLPKDAASMKFWTPPVLCNGRIYCRNWFGDLVCIDVRQ